MTPTLTRTASTVLRALGASLLALPATAQLVVPGTTARSVWSTADASDGVDSDFDVDFDATSDMGAFQAAAAAYLDPPVAIASGGGTQDSTIEPTRVVASGTCFATADSFSPGWDGSTWGIAELQYDFVLNEKAGYRLQGTISAFDLGECDVRLARLSGPPFAILESADGPSETVVFDRSGVLDPGSYRFTIVCEGAATNALGFQYASGEFELTFELSPLVETVCVGAPNSTGVGTALAALGSTGIAAGDLVLEASDGVPGVFGLFFHGPTTIAAPFGDGLRCVGGQVRRLQPPVQHDGAGVARRAIDLSAPPFAAGERRTFQLWYRDPSGPGGSGFNTSDALRITVCP